MYLRSIQLENYRRFKWAQLDFPDGIVGIIGNNGAGKSTLMEAVAWALYGTEASRASKEFKTSSLAGFPKSRRKTEEIKTTTAKISDVCRAILDFQIEDQNYRVVRELKGVSNSVDASVLINKKVAARGTTASNELIEKTLGMDYKAFVTSFFAKQRELNTLSDFQPYKRKELLTRMLGIETIDSALKNLRMDIRILEEKLSLNKTYLKDKMKLESERGEKEKSLLILEDDLKDKSKRFQSHLVILKDQEKLWEELKSKYEEYNSLIKEKSIKQTEKTSIQDQLAHQEEEKERLLQLASEKEKLDPLLVSYDELKKKVSLYDQLKIKAEHKQITLNQLRNLEKSTSSDQERIAFLEKELGYKKEVEKSLIQLKEELILVERKLEQARNIYMKLEASFKSTKDQRVKLESQMTNIEELGPDSVCDRCLRPMGDDYHKIRKHLLEEQEQFDKKLQALEKERNEVKEEGKKLKRAKTKLEEEKERLQKSLENLLTKEGEMQNLKSGLEEKERNLLSLNEVLKNLGEVAYDSMVHENLKIEFEQQEKIKEKTTQLASEIKKIPQIEKAIAELQNKIKLLTQDEEKLEAQLQTLQFFEEEYKKGEKDLEEKRKETHDAELLLKDLTHNMDTLKKEIEQIDDEIKKTEEMELEIKKKEEERLYLEKLALLFSDFRVSLIGRIRPTLARYAKSLFLELCENRYQDLELDEDYEIFISDQGERFYIERFSGGETDLANLCLRIAISLLISESSGVDFSFIILDEIFGSQDALRKENILSALAKLKNRFRQIFLITHIDDIKDSVENLVYVTENEDGTSELQLQ
jgi:exonuclease SbcC